MNQRDPEFIRAANDLVEDLRNATVDHGSIPWIGVTALYDVAEELINQGWTKNPEEGQ